MPKDILKLIADNPTLFDALQDLFLAKFSLGELTHEGKTNEELGAVVRASVMARAATKDVFKEIAQYKTQVQVGQKTNPGR